MLEETQFDKAAEAAAMAGTLEPVEDVGETIILEFGASRSEYFDYALRLARDALERVFGRRPVVVRAGGTLPVLAALAARGVPTVMTGLALPESHTHSPNERMLVETFPLGVAAARETYRALATLSLER